VHVVKPEKNAAAVRQDRKRRVLAIVGDTQVGLWLVRSLSRNGLTVHAIVNSPQGQSAHSRYAASAWMLDSRPHEPGFAAEILQLASELDVGAIMPVSEGYHNALISLRDQLAEKDIHLFSPSREAFDKATDKDFIHALCTELGVPVAREMRLDELMADGAAGELQPRIAGSRYGETAQSHRLRGYRRGPVPLRSADGQVYLSGGQSPLQRRPADGDPGRLRSAVSAVAKPF